MTRATASQLGGQNVCAFLDMLAVAEGTQGKGDDGYNVIVGNSLFSSYAAHPEKVIWLPRYKKYSSAAGRYQFIKMTWFSLKEMLHLTDFAPITQDLAAVELIRGRGALADLKAGRFEVALVKCKKEWASLPGAGYGQREVAFTKLKAAYEAQGGRYA